MSQNMLTDICISIYILSLLLNEKNILFKNNVTNFKLAFYTFFTLHGCSSVSKISATFLKKWAVSFLFYEILSVLILFLAVLCDF